MTHARNLAAPAGRLAAALALALSLPACDSTPEGRVKVYPVTGQVLFRGKPLADALVSFHAVEKPKDVPTPTGRTDPEGKFRLMTYAEGDGAPAGAYLVAVSGMPASRTETGLLNDLNKKAPAVDLLKGKYLDPKANDLRAEVKAGENTLPPFELN